MTVPPIRYCDECQWWQDRPQPTSTAKHGHRCDRGHKPRWSNPRFPDDREYGWRKRCPDFKGQKPEVTR